LSCSLPETLRIAGFGSFISESLSNLSLCIALQPVIEAKLGKEERLKWAQDSIAKGFSALERILEKTAGKYCFGDMVTLADVVLSPQLANAIRFQLDMVWKQN